MAKPDIRPNCEHPSRRENTIAHASVTEAVSQAPCPSRVAQQFNAGRGEHRLWAIGGKSLHTTQTCLRNWASQRDRYPKQPQHALSVLLLLSSCLYTCIHLPIRSETRSDESRELNRILRLSRRDTSSRVFFPLLEPTAFMSPFVSNKGIPSDIFLVSRADLPISPPQRPLTDSPQLFAIQTEPNTQW